MQKTIGKKSLLALLLALTLLCGLLPLQALAASGESSHTVWIEPDTNYSARRRITVNDGETIGSITTPRKPGHYFAGWYSDTRLTDRWDLNRDKVTKNMSLYAKWEQRDDYDDYDYYDSYGYGYGYGDRYRNDYYYDYDEDGYRYRRRYDDDYDYYDYYGYDYWWYSYDGDYSDYWNRRTAKVDVEGAEEQVYRGDEDIRFTVRGKNRAGLLAVIVYPKGDRNKETILKNKTDYTTSTDNGLTITLTENYLDSLKKGKYEVRIFFTAGQGNALFEVK